MVSAPDHARLLLSSKRARGLPRVPAMETVCYGLCQPVGGQIRGSRCRDKFCRGWPDLEPLQLQPRQIGVVKRRHGTARALVTGTSPTHPTMARRPALAGCSSRLRIAARVDPRRRGVYWYNPVASTRCGSRGTRASTGGATVGRSRHLDVPPHAEGLTSWCHAESVLHPDLALWVVENGMRPRAVPPGRRRTDRAICANTRHICACH